ncbi:MAG: hypothetical protein WC364_02400 [Eubacteriales bacterium]
MKKTDVLVIGGSAGGIFTAITAKKIHKDKSVLLARKTGTGVIPGGVPYIFIIIYICLCTLKRCWITPGKHSRDNIT